jgi:ribosome recycling factor
MVDKILAETKGEMDKAVEAFQREVGTVRTGRANASLLDSIRVEYYGSQVPVNQVASIAIPEPRLIVLQPFDKAVIRELEKAIQASNLGLNPSNDGNVVRLPIPQLTEERRKDLVKVVKGMGEDCKVSVRNHRRDGNDLLKAGQKDGEIPEDEAKRGTEQIQQVTDGYVKRIEALLVEKEAEIMEV